jgi:hypothetical protein
VKRCRLCGGRSYSPLLLHLRVALMAIDAMMAVSKPTGTARLVAVVDSCFKPL